MGIFSSKSPHRVIICGLDNSGKSTIINQLKSPQKRSNNIVPTIGYNVEEVECGSIKFTVFDMSGAKKFRTMWEAYYKDAEGVIFVVDSADVIRLTVAQDELATLVTSRDLGKNVPILVLANKMDMIGAKNTAELCEIIEFSKLLGNRPFKISASDAKRRVGIEEGFKWLSDALEKGKKSKK